MKNHKVFLMSLILGLLAVVSFWSSDVKADSLSDGSQTGYYTYSNGYKYYVLNDGSYYYWENDQWVYVAAQEPAVVEEDADESEEADIEEEETSMEDIYNCWCWPIIGKRQNPAAIPTIRR